MAKSPNFKRNPVPPPAPAAGDAPGLPPGTVIPTRVNPGEPDAKLPLRAGEATMTEATKKQLEVIGWTEGDPIPGDLGVRVQKAQERAKADTASATHGFKPGAKTKVGKAVELADLPPEEIARLSAHMAEYKDEAIQQAAADAAAAEREQDITKTADPSVQDAQRSALAAAAVQQVQAPEVVIESATPRAPPPAQPQQAAQAIVDALPPNLQPREGAQVASAEGIADFVTKGLDGVSPQVAAAAAQKVADIAAEIAAEPVDEPEHNHEESAGGAAPLERCPRCLWKLSEAFEAVPTEQDKQLFVAGILGMTRFSKAYELMGGRLRVTYRSLTSDEVDLVFHQMGIESRNGKILTEPEYMMTLSDYRLVLSVERITDGAGQTLVECPAVFDVEYDEPELGSPEETRMVPMRKWFMDEVCPQESLRRLVLQHHRVFQRVVESLESMTAEPDFWNGIGQQL